MSIRFVALLALLVEFASALPAFFKIADLFPYCSDPVRNAVTLKPNTISGTFKAESLTTTWYVIANNNAFFLAGCRCSQLQIGKFDALQQDAASKIFCLGPNNKLTAKSFEIDVARGLKDVEDSEAAFRFNIGASSPFEYVLDAAADFTWVLLGEPCRRGYILLSVTPDFSDEQLAKVNDVLKANKFAISDKFLRKTQSCPAVLPDANLIPGLPKKVQTKAEIVAKRQAQLKVAAEERQKKEAELKVAAEVEAKKEEDAKAAAKAKGIPYVPKNSPGKNSKAAASLAKAIAAANKKKQETQKQQHIFLRAIADLKGKPSQGYLNDLVKKNATDTKGFNHGLFLTALFRFSTKASTDAQIDLATSVHSIVHKSEATNGPAPKRVAAETMWAYLKNGSTQKSQFVRHAYLRSASKVVGNNAISPKDAKMFAEGVHFAFVEEVIAGKDFVSIQARRGLVPELFKDASFLAVLPANLSKNASAIIGQNNSTKADEIRESIVVLMTSTTPQVIARNKASVLKNLQEIEKSLQQKNVLNSNKTANASANGSINASANRSSNSTGNRTGNNSSRKPFWIPRNASSNNSSRKPFWIPRNASSNNSSNRSWGRGRPNWFPRNATSNNSSNNTTVRPRWLHRNATSNNSSNNTSGRPHWRPRNGQNNSTNTSVNGSVNGSFGFGRHGRNGSNNTRNGSANFSGFRNGSRNHSHNGSVNGSVNGSFSFGRHGRNGSNNTRNGSANFSGFRNGSKNHSHNRSDNGSGFGGWRNKSHNWSANASTNASANGSVNASGHRWRNESHSNRSSNNSSANASSGHRHHHHHHGHNPSNTSGNASANISVNASTNGSTNASSSAGNNSSNKTAGNASAGNNSNNTSDAGVVAKAAVAASVKA